MPGGFLQLLTAGKESEYLNNTPNISFFKSYFRRHTNFFINNLEIFGNYYEKTEVNTFLIPKSGDLLSKGFLKFNMCFLTFSRISNPFSTPKPRKLSCEERFALSKEDL